MDPKEFQRRLKALEHDFQHNPINNLGHQLDICTRCTHCVFCRDCDRCYRCAYCQHCTDATNLTHCRECAACHHLANSVQCHGCINSAYLLLCRDCAECHYCFGCVGLNRKDFHILNEPYSRADYFRIVNQLVNALSLPTP